MPGKVIPMIHLAALQDAARKDIMAGKVSTLDASVFTQSQLQDEVAKAQAALSHAAEANNAAAAVAPNGPIETLEALPTAAKVGIAAGIALIAYKILGKR